MPVYAETGYLIGAVTLPGEPDELALRHRLREYGRGTQHLDVHIVNVHQLKICIVIFSLDNDVIGLMSYAAVTGHPFEPRPGQSRYRTNCGEAGRTGCRGKNP